MTLNIRSIPNNLDNFIYDILHPLKCSPDILSFTETRLSPDIEEFYNIPNYSLVCNSRNRNEGGICNYTGNSHAFYVCNELVELRYRKFVYLLTW